MPSPDRPAEKVAPTRLKTGRKSLYYWLVVLGAVMASVGAVALWKTAFRTPGAPRVLRFTQLTNDGQPKTGPMATDGSRIYFTEVLPDQRTLIVQVSPKGGEAVPLLVPLRQPAVLDLSKDGSNSGSE